jgi:hypothetical protein
MRNVAATPGIIAIGSMIPVSGWWFVQVNVLIDTFSVGIGHVSVQALQALLLLQCLSVCLFVPHWVTTTGEVSSQRRGYWQIGLPVLFALLPAWPLLAMLVLASGASAGQVAMAEVLFLASGLVVALVARIVHNLGMDAEITRLLLGTLGLVAAALVWWFRIEWFDWIGL